MISNIGHKTKGFHFLSFNLCHFTCIWLTFLFIFAYQNYANANSAVPQPKPSIFDLTGERFFIPTAKKSDLLLMGFSLEDYANFYEYFTTNVAQVADEDEHNAIKKLELSSESELLNKITTWYHLRSPHTNPNVTEMYRFIQDNPHWPDQGIIREKIEESFYKKTHDTAFIRDYFDKYTPISGDGTLALSILKFQLGEYKLAKIHYDEAWHRMKLSQNSKDIFTDFCEICISKKDQIIRFNRMLYLDDIKELQNTAKEISDEYLLLAKIAQKLDENKRVSSLDFNKIEPYLGNNSSFHYLKIKWLVEKGSTKDAYEYFNKYKNTINITNPILWAVQSEILGRRLISQKKYREAYEVMTIDQKQKNQIFANLEFLKGWIALRIFKDRPRAVEHFQSFSQLGNNNEDRSSALYWIAKSYQANDEKNEAIEYLMKASKFENTYYGLLSKSEILIEKPEIVLQNTSPVASIYENNIDSEQLLAIELLCAVNKKYFAAKFINNLYEKSNGSVDPNILIDIANSKHLPQTSLRIARKENLGNLAVEDLYPTADFPIEIYPDDKGYEIRDLLHSVIRQESEFSSEAISFSGAVGLMQIMPNTAKMLSRLEKLDYSEERLLGDTHYNIQLGTRYLLDLLDTFEGSDIYAISSYNAGPTRVKSWIRKNPDLKIIDWIELIPYRETRNYVKSVLRNRYYYKIMLYTDKNNIKFSLI